MLTELPKCGFELGEEAGVFVKECSEHLRQRGKPSLHCSRNTRKNFVLTSFKRPLLPIKLNKKGTVILEEW